MPRLSQPHLPGDYLQGLLAEPAMVGFDSKIFTESFHNIRVEIVDGVSPNQARCKESADGAGRPFLHYAVQHGDVPLACEMIRLGAESEVQTEDGKTPLLIALETIAQLKSPTYRVYARRTGGAALTTNTDRLIGRLRLVVRVLLEQHADVNVRSRTGSTLLQLACAAKEWDIAEQLLQHGVPRSPQPTGLTTAEERRLQSLFRAIPSNASRPARKCPCFSGETLLACHAVERKPYPPGFLCRCRSKKTFQDCCARRKVSITEIWDEEEQWIQPSRGVVKSFAAIPEQQRQEVVEAWSQIEDMQASLPEGFDTDEAGFQFQKLCIEGLFEEGLIDPAFMYGFTELRNVAIPQGRMESKLDCIRKRDIWNTVVDKYIASGIDSRSPIEIERAAKVGITCGALYRVCEAPDCNKLEGKDVVKLHGCAKCKIAVYCSKECQKASWPTHKKACGAPGQLEQALPSQTAILNRMYEGVGSTSSWFMDRQRRRRDGVSDGGPPPSDFNLSLLRIAMEQLSLAAETT